MPENDPSATADDKDSPTPNEGSPSSSSISYSSCSDDCRHLAHIEAIPIRHGGRLRLVRRARVAFTEDTWHVINWNCGGPDIDICYRVPGHKNTWIARLSTDDNGKMMLELLRLIESRCTDKQKVYDRNHYIGYDEEDGEDAMSIIIELFEGTGEGSITEVLTEPEKIPLLQAKLGFGVMEY
ncbi:hypothetical protein FVEN_g3929 [Fusarium venenatum]|uniref:Uncharacterized protein n=1 Tax=Fusarium venenatum TaxID=56646 RepID=A0A2L2TH54_9HYPO|nr:uncharacterized protein FVRRES_09406 [Fusarium venenatum]KAG8358382.1 hypothetical protein FVEN_g3929 [Fusarium venenatum]KAH6966085.1 hypothetical protein EDB82DRAFT_319633 [Fusarium venenatum]CEI69329.1 unnamed protein product [Fusarium venenatum]